MRRSFSDFRSFRCRGALLAGGIFALVVSFAQSVAVAAEMLVVPGARIAIVGDSITEQKLYSKYMEAYLLACSGVKDVSVFQFGWSGERAPGFAARLENDLAAFKPNVATLCYGMNDGSYKPFDDQIGGTYEKAMRDILKKLAGVGVTKVVVGSPGAVDDYFFRPGQMFADGKPAHESYNDNLAHLRDIDKKLAEETKQNFADVHSAMYDTMKKAQAKLGPKYPVCGGDGFHPGTNGQLLMAYAFLKGLGVDGNIGEINVDMKSSGGGKVELESTRWPFCFDGDPASPTRTILPFVAFNADLNRYTLKVANLEAPKAKVTWGNESKTFTREQLTAGVNLMDEFAVTPFDGAFQKLLAAIAAKQSLETYMIKNVITNFRNIPAEAKEDPEIAAAYKKIGERMMVKHAKLDADVKQLVVPVKHTLSVEPIQ
ncbi:MAG: SGNH/GDSL hydrolase family protein [Planctomycetia bacterium]|nr:SGNH/GDSL hydrolase family protein [Planctomycetia bacterium]